MINKEMQKHTKSDTRIESHFRPSDFLMREFETVFQIDTYTFFF